MAKIFTLGENIKFLRELTNTTQEQLANAVGYSASLTVVSLWEQDKREPNKDTLCRIADFFKVDVDTLLSRKKLWCALHKCPVRADCPSEIEPYDNDCFYVANHSSS